MSTLTEAKSSASSVEAKSPTVVVVAGASRGIGLQYVKTLLQRKNTVVYATARTPSTAIELSALSTVHVLQLTVDDEKSIAAFAVELAKQTKHVDLLINNAGINQPKDTPLEGSFSLLLSLFATNAIGPLMVAQAVYPLLQAASKLRGSSSPAKVVNISSFLGQRASHTAEWQKLLGGAAYSGYRASKGALNTLSRSFALNLPDVIFLSQCPGQVKTDMNPYATVTAEASVVKQLKNIDAATLQQSGLSFGVDGEVLEA